MPRHPRRSFAPVLAAIAVVLGSVPATAATTPTSTGPAAYLVRDLISGTPTSADTSSEPVHLTALGNRVVFLASEPSSGQEVWVSDGSSGGTEMLADVCPGVCSSQSRILGTQRGLVYWVGSTDSGFYSDPLQLWRSDGTRAGTFPLTDPNANNLLNQETSGFAFTGRYLFYNACAAGTGCAVWRTDGTVAGTVRVAPLTPSWNGSYVFTLVAAGERVFYTSQPSDGVTDLWVTDGSAAGTKLVKTFPLNQYPGSLTAAGSRLFFVGSDGEEGSELWTSDGTAAGTRPLTQFANSYPFVPPGFWASGNRLYFAADDVTHGRELWRSDGTAAGTMRITDFGYHTPFSEYVTPDSFVDLGGKVVFVANDGLHGNQLWATSGTPESTHPLSPLCDLAEPVCMQVRLKLVRAGNRVLFTAGDSDAQELWSTDGTAGGTRMVQDLCPAHCGGVLSTLVAVPGGAVFAGREAQYPAPQSLWRSDGTAAGTRRVAAPGPDVQLLGDEGLEATAGADGRIFFAAGNLTYGQELWTSDGTARGTRMVNDLSAPTTAPSPRS
ncbi:MAG TPA: hypothetical protein VHU81_18390 [Thermoanaerobaculia bacterium]|nr:hypothetical protein [Thermoanaerobaculia bacterium]